MQSIDVIQQCKRSDSILQLMDQKGIMWFLVVTKVYK